MGSGQISFKKVRNMRFKEDVCADLSLKNTTNRKVAQKLYDEEEIQ
ncbi:hypothetical protein AN619_23780 [Thermotalea metallivorans]|uniref:Uncharacterized protein n=1 Tax=Thermotalea metallivorans TaxID=520762 RepID=A0A140L1H0_9FIRM|nr:hypothetical protein AN619_23780 [Thermotalea metallivorans]